MPDTTTPETAAVTLRWLDITDEDLRAALLLDTDGAKGRALERLGIAREPGEHALTAWCRAMHAENGLPYSAPAHPAIRDAYEQGPASLSRFIFWIA